MARFQKGNTAGASTRWQPGQSGNPGGLPPIIRGVRLLAGERAPRAIQRLSELVESTDDRIALAAAIALLDRAGVTPLEMEVQLGSRMPLLDDPLEVPEMDEADVRRLASTPVVVALAPAAGLSARAMVAPTVETREEGDQEQPQER
ncbi:MAG TPA: hypothetical protein VEB43_16850 [Anaeromyxobacter sp.]|nr:hypothetical protein [Anaeromyxobacter sp.]